MNMLIAVPEMMKLVAVCVSSSFINRIHGWTIGPLSNPILDIPLVQYIDKRSVGPRGTFERVKAVAEMRNEAVKIALQAHPDTTDILMIDSYYVNQTKPLMQLINNYYYNKHKHIRGGAIWRWSKTGIFRQAQFYDHWVNPNIQPWYLIHPRGSQMVRCVGGVYIFPVDVWTLRHYGVPFPLQTEHYAMLKNCDYPIILDFDCNFWRKPSDSEVYYYPWSKRIRVFLGKWRRSICAH